MKGKIADHWLKLIRLYTFNSPIRRGKYRLFQYALKQVDELPEKLQIVSQDGRVFAADMKTQMYNMVYFLGEYENYVTKVIGNIVRDDDICFDVGANFGWFTTFLVNKASKTVPRVREVHAFEPLPSVFENLCQNLRLAGSPGNVFLNNFALTDEISETKIYIFDELASGHSSLSKKASDRYSEVEIKTNTLNKYTQDRNIPQIDFLKIDIEGAELKFLKGASRMFSQKVPPLFVMEMALGTTKNFDYLPDDLIQFIKSKAEYDFYALDEAKHCLKQIEFFKKDDIGANVLCIPKNADQTRLDGLVIKK